ncbi:hypothetical protein [Bradyrhizobium sp. RP6]|uniref:hypothetical protein n=1 Tax=Bradyrhizobium sp. RP6 TaxID=2489596 RepID=UPI000F53AF28|nr:hypothetical protein [Bradyrhizobium sp. RP6]RQH06250.1 hypothetical protein EHH60_30930 [Bradyrhizobium sp. RP6]
MNYSSAAACVIDAVNRLLIAAMTSAWISALNHQHAAPPEGDGGDDDQSSLDEASSSAPEGAGKQTLKTPSAQGCHTIRSCDTWP